MKEGDCMPRTTVAERKKMSLLDNEHRFISCQLDDFCKKTMRLEVGVGHNTDLILTYELLKFKETFISLIS